MMFIDFPTASSISRGCSMPRLIAGGYHYLVNVAWLLLSFLVCATKLILFIYIYILYIIVCLSCFNYKYQASKFEFYGSCETPKNETQWIIMWVKQ